MENFKERSIDSLRPSPKGETKEVILEEDRPKRTVQIVVDLGDDVRINLIRKLQNNVNVFAFLAHEMPRIDPSFMVHQLNVNKDVRLVKQKRTFSTEKNVAIKEEVLDKLLAEDFIEPCDYSKWVLADVCLFTNLNKACPKDS